MDRRAKRRDGTKELFWRRAARRREKSGLSVRAFCGQEGLGESAFYFWRRELQKRDAENAPLAKPAASNGTKESLGSIDSLRPAFAVVAAANLEETNEQRRANESRADERHAIEIVMRDSIRVRVLRGFDAQTLCDVLAAMVEQVMQQHPLSGNLFAFRNKRADRVKLPYWEDGGLAIWYKRLEEGCFRFPRAEEGQTSVTISAADLAMLSAGRPGRRGRAARRHPSPRHVVRLDRRGGGLGRAVVQADVRVGAAVEGAAHRRRHGAAHFDKPARCRS